MSDGSDDGVVEGETAVIDAKDLSSRDMLRNPRDGLIVSLTKVGNLENKSGNI